jgi:Raf kinase inhibitor-like YbhB/YbcL family protein
MRVIVFAGALLLAGSASAGAADFRLTSPDVAPGGRIADQQIGDAFGCAGKNVSPALRWSGAPTGAKSFAVGVFDPDAHGGFWHWLIVDIPAGAAALAKNAGDADAGLAPAGAVETLNDAGRPGYFGPCPPTGDKPHHYHFEVFALDVDKLGVDDSATAAAASARLSAHTLAKAEFVGLWGR